MASRRRKRGFFSDWRRLALVVALGGALLAVAIIVLLRLVGPKEPEEVPPNPIATITMSDGSTMRFTLYPDLAPNTVANFISLANGGFYDRDQARTGKQHFFRVVAGVFIQGGDPLNNGTGDPGYAIKGEFAENGFEQNTISHMRGTISMARPSGYDTAGSQFFIMQGSYPEYDGRYAAFGRIDENDAESFATLDAIGSQPTDSTYLPLTRQVIASIRVETFDADYGAPEKIDREQGKQ